MGMGKINTRRGQNQEIISRTIIILKHIDAKVLCNYSETSRNSKKFHKKSVKQIRQQGHQESFIDDTGYIVLKCATRFWIKYSLQ